MQLYETDSTTSENMSPQYDSSKAIDMVWALTKVYAMSAKCIVIVNWMVKSGQVSMWNFIESNPLKTKF